ncbi:hypothetical protein D0T50_02000 [Bacteroides sp. 214]|nr:hypothetical protein [Bacteroides sp. 214]
MYTPLNAENPIEFNLDHIIYQGERIDLGAHSFFIDGQLPDHIVANLPYVFNSINDAVAQISDGTKEAPMTLHIAPYVYWIDDPDDPAIRVAQEGEGLPYGIILKCNHLKFHGLSSNPEHVIIAANRGQTMGAKGNFTLFKITGDDITTENITFANYCNIDLEYPLKPEFNRKKRGEAIVQAQLILCNSDRVFAKNCHFISRLNTMPFYGSGKRVLFVNCHFEQTDDALCKTAIHLDCTFDFYSSKPFGSTIYTGAIFMNCDIRCVSNSNEQFFTKGGDQVAVLDSRLSDNGTTYWGWRDFPADECRNYQHNVTLNDKPFIIGKGHNPLNTVVMTGKPLMDAYYFKQNGKLQYNLYGLLQGNDDWDPMNLKEATLVAELQEGKRYTDIPMQLRISTSQDTLETGKSSLALHTVMKRFGNIEVPVSEDITWSIAQEHQSYARLSSTDKRTCTLFPTNQSDSLQKILVFATSTSGLEAAAAFYILPEVLAAPVFKRQPKLIEGDSKLSINYALDTKYPDQSLITWYRCSDKLGNNAIEVAVSRMNEPKREYILTPGDVGSYILATIEPKDLRSEVGEVTRLITRRAIQTKETRIVNPMKLDFKSISSRTQPFVRPGYFTLDAFAPEDTNEFPWEANTEIDPWYYGYGVNGAAHALGFVQNTKGARLRYTPVGNSFGNMKMEFTAVPAKTAGQGFSSATAQYMDVFIKFDTETLNGYALRLVRTTKYGNAIDMVFVRYENGKAQAISEPVSTTCYKPDCRITLEARGNKLIATAKQLPENITPEREGLVKEVYMETEFTPNTFGGFGFQHTGTVWGGASVIKDMTVEWK